MGLSHTISSNTSDFINIAGYGGGSPTVYGFGDAHRGGFYSVALSSEDPSPSNWVFSAPALFCAGFVCSGLVCPKDYGGKECNFARRILRERQEMFSV